MDNYILLGFFNRL